MAERLVCLSLTCGAVTPGRLHRCPVCGGPANPQSHMRVIGRVLAVCGVLLLAIMALVCWFALPPVMWGMQGDRGDVGEALLALGVFAAVVGTGGTLLWAGLSQARSGRRDSRAFRVFALCAGTFLAAGLLARAGFFG